MIRARRAGRTLGVALGLTLMLALPAQATTYVLMDFNGDAAFPSLTYSSNTAGLAPFTGAAFGLNAASLANVEALILANVAADYAAYDIAFVTSTAGLVSWYTWGIDDTAYVAPNAFTQPAGVYEPIDPSLPCPPGNAGCFRLFGKARNNPGDTDRAGANIYNPTYARTWAGSFAIGPGGADPSNPSLFGATDAEIGQALGNSAAHEIAHLFGVGHPAACAAPCFDLMWVNVEGLEATRNKSFTAGDAAILLRTLGPAQGPGGGEVPEPATVTLVSLGVLEVVRRRRSRR